MIQNFIRTVLYKICFFIFSAIFLICSFWIMFLPQRIINIYLKKVYFNTVQFLMAKILKLKIEVKGEHRLHQMEKKYGCFLAVSKHQSSIETVFYPKLFKKYPVFVHKKELLYIPFWGQYMWKMGMIAIDRSSRISAIKTIVKKARITKEQKRPIIIFPEGTRTPIGKHNKYQSGFYSIYKDLNVPILPIALNTGIYWDKKQFIKRPGTMTISILPMIEPGKNKKELMQLIEKTIENETNRLCKTTKES